MCRCPMIFGMNLVLLLFLKPKPGFSQSYSGVFQSQPGAIQSHPQTPEFHPALSQSYSGETPSYPKGIPSYSGAKPSFSEPKPSNSGSQSSYSGETHSYPGETHSYPGETHSYPGETHSYPGKTDSYPGETHSYPGETLSYPGETHSYPGESQLSTQHNEIYSNSNQPVLKDAYSVSQRISNNLVNSNIYSLNDKLEKENTETYISSVFTPPPFPNVRRTVPLQSGDELDRYQGIPRPLTKVHGADTTFNSYLNPRFSPDPSKHNPTLSPGLSNKFQPSNNQITERDGENRGEDEKEVFVYIEEVKNGEVFKEENTEIKANSREDAPGVSTGRVLG